MFVKVIFFFCCVLLGVGLRFYCRGVCGLGLVSEIKNFFVIVVGLGLIRNNSKVIKKEIRI